MSIFFDFALKSGLIFISSWILPRKVFLDFNGARLFFQKISAMKRFLCKFFLLTRNSDQGLMNDRYYFEKTRSSEIILRFQNKLLVSVVLTNCFRKKFSIFLNFAFICYIFVVQQLFVPIQISLFTYFLGVVNESRQIIQCCYLMSVLT